MKNNVNNDNRILDASYEPQQAGLLKALWIFFSAMRTAIVLLLILAFISILGTVIRQNASPEEYTAIYGAHKYAIIKYLCLNDVYNSWYYRLVLSLIGINLFVCSINRFKVTWRRTFKPDTHIDIDKIDKMQRSETAVCVGKTDEVSGKLSHLLHKMHYSIMKDNSSDGISIYASKGRFSLWGPYMTHLSLLVIFIGAIYGNILGFKGYTSIDESGYTSTYTTESLDKEKDLGFKLGLRNFDILHDAKGNPKAYRSDLQVYDNDKITAEKVIDVNHPLTYKGISFYQNDCGISGLKVRITGSDGESAELNFDVETLNDPRGKTYAVSGEPFKQINIDGKLLTVFIHNIVPDYKNGVDSGSDMPVDPAANIMVNDRFPEYKGLDAWNKLGWLQEAKSARFKDLTISLDDVVYFTDLQVSRNPGLPIIYTGFALLIAGVFTSFYVPFKSLKIKICKTEPGVKVYIGASSKYDASIFDSDFTELRNILI